MSAESESAILSDLLEQSEAERADERKAEAAERKALLARIDALAEQVRSLDSGKIEALTKAVNDLRTAAQSVLTMQTKGKGGKESKRALSVTVTARDDQERISELRIN